ncbi:MAG: MMPL family transporter [Solirubrobacterales bacterium]
MFNSLAAVTTSRPKRVIAIGALIAIVAMVASAGLPQRLASQGFVNNSSESQRALNEIAAAAKIDVRGQIIALVSIDGKPITSPAGRSAVAEAAKALAQDKDVAVVATPFQGAATNTTLIAKNGESAIAIANLKPGREEGDSADRLTDAFAQNKNVTLGGGQIAQHKVSKTVESDLRRAEMLAFPLLFILSLFVFRGMIAAALPLLIGAITIPVTFGMISLYDQITDLSVFALNLTTGLGLGLAIDYSLLMVTRFREELDAGHETPVALGRTINTAGRTIAFSSLTVAGSAAALTIFPLKFLYSMGLGGATVALASAAVSLTVLPAILMLLGPRINSFSLARKPIEHSNARWYALAHGVMKRPVTVALATTALIFVMALPALGIRFTSVDATVLPASVAPHIVENAVQHDYPHNAANSSLFVVATAPKDGGAKVAAVRKQAAAVDGVTGVAPAVYIGENRWRFDAYAGGPRYSSDAQQAVKDLRAIDSPLTRWVGGSSAQFVDQRATILDRTPLALLIIGAITFVVLFLMTGSVVLPIKTFIMNLLTLAATFGLLTLIFQDGRLESLLDYNSQSALEMTQPVLLFAIAFGLATDYGVFLLGRIKELHDGGLDNNEAVAVGVSRTGRVITSAALLFCVAILAFSTSQIVFIKELGVGTALAVAIDATIIRAFLVPALMVLLGDYNWWSPRWMKRIYERFGIRENPLADDDRAVSPRSPVAGRPAVPSS